MTPSNCRHFGTTAGGEEVLAVRLDNGLLACGILTYGATLRALWVPDGTGRRRDVVLGYDTLEEYQTREGYFGALVGRYANRIAAGRFTLGGKEYVLARNDGDNHLHGGLVGFSHRVWRLEELTADMAVLELDSPDGEEGYPGNLRVRVTYELEGSSLVLRCQSRCDRETVCSLTNHSYFNLAGHDGGEVLEERVCIHAQSYTPAGPGSIPTGEIAPVAGTPMDLRELTAIGAHVNDDFPQLRQAGGYDHNYVVDGRWGALRPAARAVDPRSGIVLTLDTTLPGVQLYTANFVAPGCPGKGGAHYGPRHAFCLETQFFPNSPNHPQFPSPVLRGGEPREDVTRYTFSLDGSGV